MADLKKKKKKKDASGRPNLVLVIFLIFFVLLSIVLGVFTYNGFAGQEEMRKDLTDAKEQADTQKKMSYFYRMLYRDARAAIGDEKLTEDEWKESGPDREAFLNGKLVIGKKEDPNKTKSDKDARDFIKKLQDNLGGGETDKKYTENLVARADSAQKQANDFQTQVNAIATKVKRSEDLSQTLLNEQKAANAKAWAKILKDAKDQLDVVQTNSDAFTKISENNRVLLKLLGEKENEIGIVKNDMQDIIDKKDKKIALLIAEQKEALEVKQLGGGGGGPRDPGQLFPLMLDINTAKPLWDYPVGKVVRVDLEVRQVTINLGSKHGIKPELTFNIFGPGPTGRAEKAMKGTIEVVKVLDTSTSLCRLTSLYDTEGKEILLNLDTRTRLSRETELPIREGDLLFNMFWGTRVAVVGVVGITGEDSVNPADQIRQMEDVMYVLNRNGMIVDSFVDPRDGQIKGSITGRTRYLIVGNPPLEAAPQRPGAKLDPDDVVKQDPMDKEVLANAERVANIKKSSKALKDDAVERGLLLISAENFANMIGYRKARSANSFELSAFPGPQLPFAGSFEEGPRRKGAPAPKNEKKEEMEKKMEEKGM